MDTNGMQIVTEETVRNNNKQTNMDTNGMQIVTEETVRNKLMNLNVDNYCHKFQTTYTRQY